MGKLGLTKKPKQMALKQACAALGQATLMNEYEKYTSLDDILCAQILVNHDDFENRIRMVNLSNTLESLFENNILPIINENDALAVEEIKVGDNDTLASLIVPMINADILVLVSDIDGLYDKNPKIYKDAKKIDVVTSIDSSIDEMVGEITSNVGTGGMATKIKAARITTKAGCDMAIISANYVEKIKDLIEGKKIGTLFVGDSKALHSKEHWMVFNAYAKGSIVVDNGASSAILKRKSLLATGIITINAYDEDKKRGLVRHVMVKRSFKTKETMVIIVTASDNFPGRSNFVKALTARCKNITTIVQNVNSRSTSAVLGNQEFVLYGKGYIIDELCGKKFKISSKSFYQINPYQTEVLYNTALVQAGLKKTDVILDAYSGVGTIGLIASSMVKKVLSVEIEKSATADAMFNAKINNIKNVSFFNDDASNFIVNLANRKEHMDAIIMDPPRSGSDEKFIKSVLKLLPEKVIYISCNPKTQVVDLKMLTEKYDIKFIQPVDMFPHTAHVENIVCLERK